MNDKENGKTQDPINEIDLQMREATNFTEYFNLVAKVFPHFEQRSSRDQLLERNPSDFKSFYFFVEFTTGRLLKKRERQGLDNDIPALFDPQFRLSDLIPDDEVRGVIGQAVLRGFVDAGEIPQESIDLLKSMQN